MAGGHPSKYETLGAIGRGGMATVSVGRLRGARGFTRLVAIKRAHAHVRGNAALAASMKHEAGLAARIHHPNVVRVIDVVEEDDDLVLVLDYVEGGSLVELLKQAGQAALLEPRARARIVVRVLLDVAAGLDAAHRALDDEGRALGIVHRDVSPSNVLVGVDGIARLTDFGIAKALEGGPELTETGELKGKIAYMAPEYIEHQRADAASDQFSLGVVAWESLAQRRLFRGPTDLETLKRVVIGRVPGLSTIDPVLAPLEPVLTRALARSEKDRYPSVRALAEELEAAARASDLVASHAEVGALVESALRDELTARRLVSRGVAEPEGGRAASGALVSTTRAGRDDVPTASVVGHAAPRGASPARPRRPVLSLALALALAGGGAAVLVGSPARTTPTPAPASTEVEPLLPTPHAEEDPENAGELDPATVVAPAASGTVRAPPARPTRSHPGGRHPVPSAGLVPRKAPPNPYVH